MPRTNAGQGEEQSFLFIFRFVGAAMARAAMRTIVITCCRPYIFPFFGAAIALVEVSKERLFLRHRHPPLVH
jgi:hypothetical protein